MFVMYISHVQLFGMYITISRNLVMDAIASICGDHSMSDLTVLLQVEVFKNLSIDLSTNKC